MTSFHHRDAARLGVTPDQLRGPGWAHPVEGVALSVDAAGDLEATCRAIAHVLPSDAVFTHLTAALLRGWWLPDVADPPTIACTDGDATHLERRGLYLRRCTIPAEHRTTLRGVPVASAAWTIVELAEHLSLIDLVVVIDGAVQLGHVDVDQVRATMRRGRRGVRVLRRALDLVDGRSESPWESVLRLLHVLCGVRVTPQVTIRDRHGGFVGYGDLGIDGTDRIVEYDGADHRSKRQHAKDLRRDKALNRLGKQRYGYVAPEIVHQPATILQDADDALGRVHRPSRLAAWTREAAASSLTAAGRAALEARLARFVRAETPRPRRVVHL